MKKRAKRFGPKFCVSRDGYRCSATAGTMDGARSKAHRMLEARGGTVYIQNRDTGTTYSCHIGREGVPVCKPRKR